MDAGFDDPARGGSARDLLKVARDNGVSDVISLRGTGIEAASLEDPFAQVQTRAELRLIANVQEALPHRADLGLDAGSHCEVGAFGMIGLLMISSLTLRDGLMASIRYQDLCCPHPPNTGRAQGCNDCLHTAARWPAPELGPYLIDHQLAALMSFSRQLGPKTVIAELELQQRRPPHAARY